MRSGASYYTGWEEEDFPPHFLDSCSLCNRPLSHNNDIFMYRGNTPFCSKECRQEQIEMDEANERIPELSSSKRSSKTARQNTEPKKEFDSKKSSVMDSQANNLYESVSQPDEVNGAYTFLEFQTQGEEDFVYPEFQELSKPIRSSSSLWPG